jgi:Xaa-Pro aminopeptidase
MEAPAETTWRGFSLAERDRRWRMVRENAVKAGFDCTFVPLCIDGRNLHLSLEQARGTRSDGRYLTLLENAAFIQPSDGRDPIVVTERGEGNAWVPETRSVNRGARGSWGAALAQGLLDLGMERARIGVVGLKGGKVTHGRAADGVVNHTAYAEVMRRLPNARFDDATDVVGFARYVKGPEELDALRRGARIAAAGIDEMAATARPGVNSAVVYARVMRRLLELGSEYYPLAWRIGRPGGESPRYEEPSWHIDFKPMHYISHETDAVVGGLIAQEQHPILLGPIPDDLRRVADLQRDLFYGGLEAMKPGTTLGELIDFTNSFGEKRGMRSLILMHGRGYGNDGPLLTPADRRAEAFRDVPFEKDNVFVWKPIAYSADGHLQVSFGGVTIVGDRGGELVTGREPGILSVA